MIPAWTDAHMIPAWTDAQVDAVAEHLFAMAAIPGKRAWAELGSIRELWRDRARHIERIVVETL